MGSIQPRWSLRDAGATFHTLPVLPWIHLRHAGFGTRSRTAVVRPNDRPDVSASIQVVFGPSGGPTDEGTMTVAINLTKGGNISLAKAAPGLNVAMLGLGWNPRSTDGAQFDLDASCLLLTADGRVRSERDFIFYNNTRSDCGSVVHLGDNRTGEGDGDDEQLRVTLSSLPPEIARIVLIASIDQAQERGQNFGMVSDAYIRFFDADAPNDDSRGARYDLAEDSATETALIVGELYLYNGEWKFRAVGQGNTSGLVGVLADFGLAGA